MAVWTYYRGALRDPGIDEGSTTVAMVPERGWFWYIPLPDDVVSVGVVAEKDYLFGQPRDLADIFHGEVEKNLWIKQHLAQGRQFGKYHTTREYSYRGEYSAEDGLVLVGDAFAFLDPVFSSGVYLALKSGELAADAVHEALLAGDVSVDAVRAVRRADVPRDRIDAEAGLCLLPPELQLRQTDSGQPGHPRRPDRLPDRQPRQGFSAVVPGRRGAGGHPRAAAARTAAGDSNGELTECTDEIRNTKHELLSHG